MWKRRASIGMAALGLFLSSTFGSLPSVLSPFHQLENRDVRAYVKHNLGGIIKIHEDNLRITFDEEPEVRWGQPRDLSASAYPEQGIALASFDPETDTIFLSAPLLRNPDSTLINLLLRKFIPRVYKQRSPTDGILSHELGHYFVDQEAESMGEGNWPPDFENYTLEEVYGIQLVSEGIACHFEKLFNFGAIAPYFDSHWPTNIDDWTNDDIYNGGFFLVQPIIAQYGLQGIRHLILNPPNECEIYDLPAYRTNMLEQLENQICFEEVCIQG
jgi:hypothetical protein